jgi:hypothetical protein
VVKTNFGTIPSIEQSKRKRRFYNSNLKYFLQFSEKCKALHGVNCISVSIVNCIHLLCLMCCTGIELVLLCRVFLRLIEAMGSELEITLHD